MFRTVHITNSGNSFSCRLASIPNLVTIITDKDTNCNHFNYLYKVQLAESTISQYIQMESLLGYKIPTQSYCNCKMNFTFQITDVITVGLLTLNRNLKKLLRHFKHKSEMVIPWQTLPVFLDQYFRTANSYTMKVSVKILPSSCWFSKLPKYLETKLSGEKVHNSMLKKSIAAKLLISSILFAQNQGYANSYVCSV